MNNSHNLIICYVPVQISSDNPTTQTGMYNIKKNLQQLPTEPFLRQLIMTTKMFPDWVFSVCTLCVLDK